MLRFISILMLTFFLCALTGCTKTSGKSEILAEHKFIGIKVRVLEGELLLCQERAKDKTRKHEVALIENEKLREKEELIKELEGKIKSLEDKMKKIIEIENMLEGRKK
jgi:hypothetical protein